MFLILANVGFCFNLAIALTSTLPINTFQGKIMNKQHLRRPRFQRAFVRWFRKNRTRFNVPISITKISAEGIELQFPKYPDYFSVRLSRLDELEVLVNCQGKLWDRLIFRDAPLLRWKRSIRWEAPQNWHEGYREGYVCIFCLHESDEAVLFPSPEALWQDHIFESFLKWVNEKLALAQWLRISSVSTGNGEESTWAQLIRDKDELSEPDSKLIELQQPNRIDGKPAYEGGTEGVTNCLIPLKPEHSGGSYTEKRHDLHTSDSHAFIEEYRASAKISERP